MPSRSKPTTRLLFDELLPWRVASALRELGYKTSYVGSQGDSAPPRGSSDIDVLEHARSTGQVVVTSNHDLIILCAEEGESVLWIDPRGRQFTRDELAGLLFAKMAELDAVFRSASEPVCVRVLRTKAERLSLDRAHHLASQRLRRLSIRKRGRKQRPAGELLETAADAERSHN